MGFSKLAVSVVFLAEDMEQLLERFVLLVRSAPAFFGGNAGGMSQPSSLREKSTVADGPVSLLWKSRLG